MPCASSELFNSRTEARSRSAKNHSDRFGFRFVDDELLVLDVVAEGRLAAHPQALLLRGGDLVADALARDLALELRERQQHVESQPTHGRRGVEGLRDRYERNRARVKDFDDFGEVGERAGQAVDLVDDHDIDPFGRDVGEQTLQRRPLHIAAGIAGVVVELGQRLPAFMLLAAHIRLAGLPLGVEGIELLLEPFLRRLAGVDRAANAAAARTLPGCLRRRRPLGWTHRSVVHGRAPFRSASPKNLGPDQWAPVISRATCVIDR